MTIGMIGCGNMGGALARGYQGSARADSGAGPLVLVYDRNADKAGALAALPGIEAAESIEDLAGRSSMVILAVKPKDFDALVPDIARSEGIGRKTVISIAAGVSISWLASMLGKGAKVIRAMPNTPALVGEGATALARSEGVTDGEFADALRIFEAVGTAVETEEGLLDAVIGVSGSSPAFAYMYIEALIEKGISCGLRPEDAKRLAARATLGAAKMVLETGTPPDILRKNVCSPGGTTIEGVAVLEDRGFMETIEAAMDAAIEKSRKMTK